ncbi:MAG: pilus assembly protein TadG-related protein [Pseudomonadota bacterium]
MKVARTLGRFWRNRAGGFALQASVLLPILLGAAAGTLDFMNYANHRSQLQEAADAAALAAVREAAIKGWNAQTAQAIASAVVQANLAKTLDDSTTFYNTLAKPDEKNRKVKVVVTQDHYPYFAARFFPTPQITVDAVATSAASSDNICVIALEDKNQYAVDLKTKSSLTASTCAVYSNSDHSNGIRISGDGRLEAGLICSSGGTQGPNANYVGNTVTNCPTVSDPLIARPKPTVGGCTYNNRQITGQTVTLTPGVYCGGLTVGSGSNVTFGSGIYIIKDGVLTVETNSTVVGRNVGFFFTGASTYLEFLGSADIDLEGPKSGPMAGMLFYQDPANGHETFTIASENARNMVGVIYLPNGALDVATGGTVSNESAYTAIIAKTLNLDKGPNLVLNTAYGSTDVPVPSALSGKAGETRLVD